MEQTYSTNDLLQLIYAESDDCCTSYKMKTQMLADEELGRAYREMKTTISQIQSLELSPRASTVDKVLAMSKSQEIAH